MTINKLSAGNTNSQAFLQGGDDGTLQIEVGPVGARVAALSIDALGNATLAKQPIVPVQSMIRLNGANGYGSTNTCIRRFLSVVASQGADMTLNQSAVNGDSVMINVAGVYAISHTACAQATNLDFGITLNSASLSNGTTTQTAAALLAGSNTVGTNLGGSVSVVVALVVGDVVRAHGDANLFGAPARQNAFTITRTS